MTVPMLEILVIDDNPGDIYVIREAIREHHIDCNLKVISNGEEALELLEADGDVHEHYHPSLILLDLNLPRLSGHVVLNRIRSNPASHAIPVVIITSSEAENDLAKSWELGASAYFVKSSRLENFMKLGGVIKEMMAAR
jgi:CheY-like chemotaxis protein